MLKSKGEKMQNVYNFYIFLWRVSVTSFTHLNSQVINQADISNTRGGQ